VSFFGDLQPDRLRRSNGSYAISFAPVSGAGKNIGIPTGCSKRRSHRSHVGFPQTLARHIRRKFKTKLKPVDNFGAHP
jgi:hypothetical protein